MDDGYRAMSQVSGTTMCKISYSWAHQPLAEISVYSKKKHTTPATCLGLEDLWHVGAAAALSWLQTPREARTRGRCGLSGVGHGRGPLTAQGHPA